MVGKPARVGSVMVTVMRARVFGGTARLGVRGITWGAVSVGVGASGLVALAPGAGPDVTACALYLLCVSVTLSLPDDLCHPQYACNCSVATEYDMACMKSMILCRSTVVGPGVSV